MNKTISCLALALWAASCLIPSHFPPWMSWHSEALAFLSILLLSWNGIVSLYRTANPSTVTLSSMTVPFCLMAVLALLQGGAGLLPFWGDVWVFLFYLALCIICSSLGFSAVCSLVHANDDPNWPFRSLALAILATALASTLIAFVQVFSLWEHMEWIVRLTDVRRPGANLAQPNHLGTLQVMGVASLVFLYQSRWRQPIIFSLLLLFLFAGIAATESRTGALSLLMLLVWFIFKRDILGVSTPMWVGIGFGVAFIVMFWAWPNFLNALDMLTYQAGGRVLEGSMRLQVWPQLLQALTLHPWTGWGIHQVAAAHNSVVDQYAVSEPFSYSHNIVLDLALWFGWPITVLLGVMVLAWCWRCIRASQELRSWYGLALALPLALHSMLEYPFAYAYFLAPVLFMLGAVDALSGRKSFYKLGRRTAVILVSTISIGGAWSIVEYLAIEEDFRVARFEAQRIGTTPPDHQRPHIILYTQLGALLDDARITPTPNMSLEQLQLVRNAALHYPWSATQYRYVLALALNGNPLEASRQIQVMRRLWGEDLYESVKRQMHELAAGKYPELQSLSLP